MDQNLPLSVTHEVRDRCLCLHLQRAARRVARRFDETLGAVGLTNGQFSLLTAMNRPEPPAITHLARFLAMDRTTLTAALKPLSRRGLVMDVADTKDRRNRRLTLTDQGRELLIIAVPIWRKAHDDLDEALDLSRSRGLREYLEDLSAPSRTVDGTAHQRP